MLLKNKQMIINRSLTSFINSNSAVSEEYKTIRINIHFSSVEKKARNRTLVITSPGFGEGKSTTTSNLAISMALQGERVLIIDADLRNPNMHSFFSIQNTTGLTNVLMGEKTLEEAVSHTEIGRLEVLTSGQAPFNPSKLLGSQAMKELMESALKQYDIVLFDSPPVLEITNTLILANQCDGVILVINQRKTKNGKAIEAKKALEFAKAKLIGFVLNERN